MRIDYVSGSRADFGLMRETLLTLDAEADIDLGLLLTGQALVRKYGDMDAEAEQSGLKVRHRIPAPLSGADTDEMSRAFAEEARGFSEFWSRSRPDLVMVLGDRAEMLAATIIAYHLQIPTAHIHGGELSGTLDEGFRHAISKLASFHFVATEDAAERLVRMGEASERITIVGAPGLVEVARVGPLPRDRFCERIGLPVGSSLALFLYHPVVDTGSDSLREARSILGALLKDGYAILAMRPNSDAGASSIDCALDEIQDLEQVAVVNHLERTEFLEAIATVDLMIGNSSSGIIESASLGTPCVNLGDRQSGRLRNENIIDCATFTDGAIHEAITEARKMSGPFVNRFGDGRADSKILAAIRSLDLEPGAAAKRNSY